MTIVNFTPISATIGGVLIGLASVLLMFLNGRIAGASGIFAGLLNVQGADKDWRIAYIAGLILAPLILGLLGHPMAIPAMPTSWALIIGAAFLVGFGARMSGGCTSGHGISGFGRLSKRSILATTVFTGTAIVTQSIMRHVIGG